MQLMNCKKTLEPGKWPGEKKIVFSDSLEKSRKFMMIINRAFQFHLHLHSGDPLLHTPAKHIRLQKKCTETPVTVLWLWLSLEKRSKPNLYSLVELIIHLGHLTLQTRQKTTALENSRM